MTMMSWLFLFMATITALTPQKRNTDRVNIFLDGEFAFGLTASAAIGLQAGQLLSGTEIAALKDLDEAEKAKKAAIRLISRRPQSKAEIERKLRKNKYDDLIIDQVIDHLIAVDLLDDVAFAEYWVEQRETFRPRSRLALCQELRQKGVSRTVIETAVEQVDETSAARQMAAKQARRWTHLPEDEYRIKLGRYLQRLGFPYDIIRDTTNSSWQAVNENEAFDSISPDFEGE
jgi:regulatory protein